MMNNSIMKATILLVCLSIQVLSQCPDGQFLQNNQCINQQCDVYFSRFSNTEQLKIDGPIIMLIKFDGEIAILNNNNLQVTIKFKDIKDDGIMKKDNPKSCIDQVLLNHNLNFKNSGTIDSSTITSNFNESIGQRLWQFQVAPTDWGNKFTKDISTPGQTKYNGYYSFKFKALNLIVQYYFQFEYILNTESNVITRTSFSGFFGGIDECPPNAYCDSNRVSSIIQFCTEGSCAAPSNTINLYLGQRFWIVQKIVALGFQSFDLKDPVVHIVGTHLTKEVIPKSQTNSLGQIILELQVDFLQNTFTVEIFSIMADLSQQEHANYRLRTESDTLNCIAPIEGAGCLTEAEVCIYNGWQDYCDDSLSLHQTLVLGVLVIILLIL